MRPPVNLEVCPELLKIRELVVEFPLDSGAVLRAIDGACLELKEREIHGLVGESGSGKTVLALSLLRLLPESGRVSGEIIWGNRNLLSLSEREMNEVRGQQIAMVFQNAQASLNPALKVGAQFASLLKFIRGISRSESYKEASRLLSTVHLSDAERILNSYPNELSVGMAQRVAIAFALACKPRLLIADEPTSALDSTVAVQILQLLDELRNEFGLSVLLISHDLAVVARLCDRVSIIKAGGIVENGSVWEVFKNPRHQYTKTLLQSILFLDPLLKESTSVPS